MTWIRDLLNKIFRNQGGDYVCSEWGFYKPDHAEPDHLYEDVAPDHESIYEDVDGFYENVYVAPDNDFYENVYVAPDNDFYENVYVAPDNDFYENSYGSLYHIYEDVEMWYIPMNRGSEETHLSLRTWLQRLEDNYGRLQVSSSILI